MDTVELLRALQLAVFLFLGVVAVLLWLRRRSAPAAYLAAAFAALAGAIVVSRFVPDATGFAGRVQSTFVLSGLLAFPWLLAAMTWSFDGRLPRWLRGVAVAFAAHTVLVLWLDVLPVGDATPTLFQRLYLAAFVALWTVPAVAAATRLFRAGRREYLVHQRMRLMAIGLLVLNLALLLAGFNVGSQISGVREITILLSFVSAAAFVAGFAPPLPLRLWWRRRSTLRFQRMQEALIGAATPGEVAQAVAPMLAEMIGGGVAVIGRDGEVQAVAHVSREQLAADRARLLSGDPLDGGAQVVEVDAYWLVVRTTPYTPLFGQGERELVDGFAIQLRLALERAELFQAHLEARAAAEAASQELEATLMGLSHDLKSPTAAIVGFSEMLEHTAEGADRDHLVTQIRTSTRYLEDLVDALLEFSKVGRTQVEVEPVDLTATVHSVSQRVSATAPQLTLVVDGDLPVVLANPVRIEQVFDNLIGNAVKHAGRDDLTVTVSATADPDGVRVRVADDGRGLAPGDDDRIFTLFARGGGASRSGTGVGLGMVRRIVESYGGTVTVVPADRGAAFEVVLPADRVVDPPWSRDHDTDGPVADRPATK